MSEKQKIHIHVCVTCKPEGFVGEDTDKPGSILARELVAAARKMGASVDVELKAVNCLSVCKRPCTVSISGTGKFTYVIGDLEPGRDVDDILAFASLYGESSDGITKWRDRPEVVRKHTIARVPPIGHDADPVSEIEVEQ